MRIHRVVRRGAVVAAIAATSAVLPFATPSFASGVVSEAPPASPTGVAAATGSKTLTVSWSEASSGSITYTPSAKSLGKTTKVCRTKLMGCTITTLANGVVYTVTVVARNVSGASAPSSPITAVVGVQGPPLAVHAIAGVASATVAWSPPKATTSSKVTAYMATASPGGYSCWAGGSAVSPPARTCVIAGLTSGVNYSVSVSAINAFGAGAPSRAASVTPT
jgi:hypothetical protein